MKKTTELRTARYICFGDIASRDPKVKDRKIPEPFHFHAVLMTRVAWSKLSNNTEDSQQQFVHKDFSTKIMFKQHKIEMYILM